MVGFIQGGVQKRVQDGFIVHLPMAEAVHIFGERLKISLIASVPQAHIRLRLILNLSEKTYEGTPSVNDTTEMEIALESIQLGERPHVSSKQSGMQIPLKAPSGFQNSLYRMRTTAELSGCPRWANSRMFSHRL